MSKASENYTNRCAQLEVKYLKNIIIKTAIYLFLFVVSTIIAWFLDWEIHKNTFKLYRFLTNDKLGFHGKNFHFTSGQIYYFSFFIFIVTYFNKFQKGFFKKVLKQFLVSIIFLILSLLSISYFESHLMLAQCTQCDDGTFIASYNSVDPGFNFGVSILIGLIPTLVAWLKKQRTTHR